MGRRARHSAKTGGSFRHRVSKNNDDNNSNNKNHLQEEEFLKLDDNEDSDDNGQSNKKKQDEWEYDDGITTGREAVLDLALDQSSEEDAESGDDVDSEEDEEIMRPSQSKQVIYDSEDDSSSSSSAASGGNKHQIFQWGSKKQDYYHGDTADLEIGQDVSDAFLEEEAGKEVERVRLNQLEEEDFGLLDDNHQGKQQDKLTKGSSMTQRKKRKLSSKVVTSRQKNRHLDILSKKERDKILHSNHPELKPLLQHFSGVIQDFVDNTSTVGKVLFKERDDGTNILKNDSQAVGSTPAGLQYLLTKSMLQASTTLNLSLYLLLKSERQHQQSLTPSVEDHRGHSSLVLWDDNDDFNDIRSHPVVDRLNQLSQLEDKLRENVEMKTNGLDHQMQCLVKAAALMNEEEEERVEDKEEKELESEKEDNSNNQMDGLHSPMKESRKAMEKDNFEEALLSKNSISNFLESSSRNNIEDNASKTVTLEQKILTEAKFGVRAQDIGNQNEDCDQIQKSAVKRHGVASLWTSDYGDETEEVSELALVAGRKLASRMNSIAQKSASSKKRHPKNQVNGEEEDDEYEQLQRGLSMMEEELGEESDELEVKGESWNDDEGGFGDEDEFYKKIKAKSEAKKETKKQIYAVAPKYPRLEEEIEGERAIGRTILKNRGLVAHKPKINRNPRVKKREQYRKALIRRKGAVREIRTEEAHAYGGESAGIKSGISRSRKFGGGR